MKYLLDIAIQMQEDDDLTVPLISLDLIAALQQLQMHYCSDATVLLSA